MINSTLDTLQVNFDADALWTMNLVLALVMFGVALEISVRDFRILLKNPKPVYVGVFSQFIALPLVTFLLVLYIKPYPSIALGMFMVAACPGGNISNFISYLANGNTALSVFLTALATVLAVVMTPINFQFWSGQYEPTATLVKEIAINPFEMVKLVSLLLGLPLVLGMLMNYWRPVLSSKIAKVLKVVSLCFFVFLIAIALYNNRVLFADYLLYIFWIVLVHNLLAFLTGYSLGRIFKVNKEALKSITIETGIQNSGLGLLLIFTFFDGLGGMALLAAFWGIWHMVSGILLAALWNYFPFKKKIVV